MGAEANGGEKQLKFLIYGRTGWIGGLLGKLCEDRGIQYEYGSGRLENRLSLEADITAVKPSHVFNAAGVTGRPNVDWCESHKVETIRTNVVGTLTLADVCRENNLILINYATGCIFEYDSSHTLGSGIGFKEHDTPNFTGSFYSNTKAMVEDLLRNYDNVCTLRVRMPISSDLSNPRNFITKITRYQKVVNIPNSMSVLEELIPISVEMAKRNLTGIWNFTNPGVVSHNEILEMYREYVDPSFTWNNFRLEEQAKVIVAPRSNNELDSSKLKKEFPHLLSIKDSIAVTLNSFNLLSFHHFSDPLLLLMHGIFNLLFLRLFLSTSSTLYKYLILFICNSIYYYNYVFLPPWILSFDPRLLFRVSLYHFCICI